jgi:dipeptidyl aminopeptidase/acylaminoacyl peptidase
VVASRVTAANDAHLLFSGFRIFSPAFRGSTGFGDEFTAANIDCQVRILRIA